MATSDKIVDQLRKARPDYQREVDWGRFLLDAYTGGGGFCGQVKPPAVSALGWVAEAYGLDGQLIGFLDSAPSESYLDQYPREDARKYAARVALAHYANYVEMILDLLVSYALKREPTIEDLPEFVRAWRESVTPDGESFRQVMRQELARNAALLGWCPVVLDRDPVPENYSEARAREEGFRVDPWMVPLAPVNVLDWYADDNGRMQWVKVCLRYCRQPDPMAEAQKVEQYKIYYPDRIEVWEVTDDKVTKGPEIVGNPFGTVPVVSFKHKPALGQKLRGASMVGDAAVASRRLFNLDSELDEHMRSNVFALLQVPVPDGQDAPDEVLGGSGNAVPVPASASQGYSFVAPPASVAETLEKRIANMVQEILRRARVFFGQSKGGVQSGISKAWDFEQTNRLLGDFAAQLADAERDLYRLVAKFYGVDQGLIDKIRVLPPTDFAVDDLAVDIENATAALSLNLGATAERLIKSRLTARLLPNMSTEDAAASEQELLEQEADTANDEAEEAEFEDATDDAGAAGDAEDESGAAAEG